jgi:hypothetical protein
MPEQYAATDKRTGLEVTVTGEFPTHPDDRIRIARTTNLFTRLTSTIFSMPNESERRTAFMAVESQLELAEALIRRDTEEIRRLFQETLTKMGVTQEQIQALEEELRRRFGGEGGPPPPPGGPELPDGDPGDTPEDPPKA